MLVVRKLVSISINMRIHNLGSVEIESDWHFYRSAAFITIKVCGCGELIS